jgi:hypothetical protein
MRVSMERREQALAPPSLATPHCEGLYAATFLPAHHPLVATAAADGTIGIWDPRDLLSGAVSAPSRMRRLQVRCAVLYWMCVSLC